MEGKIYAIRNERSYSLQNTLCKFKRKLFVGIFLLQENLYSNVDEELLVAKENLNEFKENSESIDKVDEAVKVDSVKPEHEKASETSAEESVKTEKNIFEEKVVIDTNLTEHNPTKDKSDKEVKTEESNEIFTKPLPEFDEKSSEVKDLEPVYYGIGKLSECSEEEKKGEANEKADLNIIKTNYLGKPAPLICVSRFFSNSSPSAGL